MFTKDTKIKFLVTPPGFPEFEAGSTHTLNGASAYRWVRREMAEVVKAGGKRENASLKITENAAAPASEPKTDLKLSK